MRFDGTVLITDHVEEMKRFYMDVMRLKLRYDFGRCQTFECGVTVWQLDQNDPAMKTPGIDKGTNSRLELCFNTDTFYEDVAHVMSHHPKMLHDIAEEAWGQRTIRFFDPDGNLIELGESIPCFCRRLHKDMSIEKVAEKTGVDIGLVRQYVGV